MRFTILRVPCISGDLGSQPLKNSGNALRNVKAKSSFCFVFSKLYLQPRMYLSKYIASYYYIIIPMTYSYYI